jgi:hypothetical protein
VFENRVLRRMFGSKMEKVAEGCGNCIWRIFITCTLHDILLGYGIKKDELGVVLLSRGQMRNVYKILVG